MRSPRTATKSSPRLPQLEKAHNEDPTQPKIKLTKCRMVTNESYSFPVWVGTSVFTLYIRF